MMICEEVKELNSQIGGFFILSIVFLGLILAFPQGLQAQTQLPSQNSTIAEEQDYAFAYGLYKDGLFQLAAEQFGRFAEKYPGSIKLPDALFLKTECLFQQEQYDAAAKGFSEFALQFQSSNLADNAHFRLGDTYLKQKKNQEAVTAYKTVLDKYPESDLAGEAAYWIGEIYIKSEEYDNAIKYYTLSYENYPNNRVRDYALYSVAWTYQKKTDYAKAADGYRRLINEFPQSTLTASSRVRIGECYYYLKDYKQAIAELAASRSDIEQAEHRGEADYLIGESYYNLNDYSQAKKQYEDFLAAYPDHKLTNEVTYALGWTLMKQNEFAAAAEVFGKLVGGKDAIAHAAFYRKGMAEKLAGKRNEGLKTLTQVFATQPKGDFADNALYDVGLILFEDKKTVEANDFFERVTKEYPQSDVLADAFRMSGECLITEGNFESAKFAFENALKQPAISFAVKVAAGYQAAWCAYKAKNYKEAVAKFTEFAKLYPSHPKSAEAMYWLAESEYNGGNYRAALKQYQAIAEVPNHERREEGLYGVAWSHFRMNEFSKAVEGFERLITAYPNGKFSFDARLRLGDCYFSLKDYKRATGVYRAVMRLFPQNDGVDYAYYQLAQAFHRSGDPEQASEQFTALLKAFPRSPLADEAQYAVGWIKFQKKDYLQAIKDFQAVITNYPETETVPRAYYSIGDAYYNLKQFASAETSYREVVVRFPNSSYVVDAMTGIQHSLIAQGKEKEAITAIDAYAKGNPSSQNIEQLSLKKAELLFNQQQYHEAAEEYRAFIAKYPHSSQKANALQSLGKSLAEGGELAEAALVFEQVAGVKGAAQKNIASSLLEAARLYRSLKKYDQVMNVLSKAETHLGDAEYAGEIVYVKGMVFSDNGDAQEARNQFEFVVAKYGSTVAADKARLGLAQIHFRAKDYNAAQTLAQKVAASRTDEIGAEAQYISGVAYFEGKDWHNAVTAFLRVRYVFPSYSIWLAKAYLGLGGAYEELKDTQNAKDAYQNVLKLQKEGDVFAEASRRLKNLEGVQ